MVMYCVRGTPVHHATGSGTKAASEQASQPRCAVKLTPSTAGLLEHIVVPKLMETVSNGSTFLSIWRFIY